MNHAADKLRKEWKKKWWNCNTGVMGRGRNAASSHRTEFSLLFKLKGGKCLTLKQGVTKFVFLMNHWKKKKNEFENVWKYHVNKLNLQSLRAKKYKAVHKFNETELPLYGPGEYFC